MTNDGNRPLSQQISVETLESPHQEEDNRLASRIEKNRVRRKSYAMDLRIHSPSSLGYLALEGIDTAPALVRLAKVKGLDVIAVTDFYSASYIDRVREAAKSTPLTVIPGVVIRCSIEACKDVVLSCLFPEEYPSIQVESFLRELGVPASKAGQADYIVGRPFGDVLRLVEERGGIAIPSRMDKTPHRKAAIKVLVEKFGFRVFDLAYYPDSVQYFKENWPKLKFHLLSFSSASALAQIGNRHSKVKMSSPGFAGIKSIAEREAASNP